MAIDPSSLQRRHWLLGTAAALLASQLPAQAASHADAALLTAWVAGDQAMAGLWHPGRGPHGVTLPNRAHEVLKIPGHAGQALAVARRPGEFLLRFDTRRAQPLQWHEMELDRFLCGHAAFSADGQTLYTTEFDAESGAGLIAERDPMSLRKRHEYASGGIGPHAMLVEPEGTLLVANGGLLILPETGRRKLNRDHMASNLARLDASTARVLDTWRVDDPFLSLRHIARAPHGAIAVASQAEHADDAARRAAPLMALLDAQGLRTLELPAGLMLEGYAGDIAHLPGRGFMVSATRAGRLAWWTEDGAWGGQQDLPKASAIAVAGSQWLASGDAGSVRGRLAANALNDRLPGLRWDNHAELLPA
ncbi:hypothetical protein RD110_19615 [Rhodoferax koreense]|uniref:Twin-arginine translocation pathway signal n=1 Tax=Rhodoferax koreensis TaxID=1842727 RepID=A0A1P8JZG2_9BURK|nr:DUF1513 domain-containing protein [Rhodoferax koreense]APW39147.1 hypothetical protein RD110_19615 [Rhodoferax koreense]